MTKSKNDDFEYDSDFYKTLLESTKAIPWRIDWKTLTFSYVGPQIEELLGWTQDSWQSVNDWAERMHPEDREWVVNFCVSQSEAGTDHEADYRALKQNGEYIWIRDVVHVIRDENGNVEALVGFMFDIDQRKKTEQRLLDLQKELEDLSYKDSLTGIHNRRMFDDAMDMAWSVAERMKQPLSVLLIDIDYFKQYNDFYGHVKGDGCLQQVAETLAAVPSRPRDFIARFGGEEFVIILPETDAESALKVAERCQQAIMNLQIRHERSAVGKHLTISIGCGTLVPEHANLSSEFLHEVDQALYRAKRLGRNQIQLA